MRRLVPGTWGTGGRRPVPHARGVRPTAGGVRARLAGPRRGPHGPGPPAGGRGGALARRGPLRAQLRRHGHHRGRPAAGRRLGRLAARPRRAGGDGTVRRRGAARRRHRVGDVAGAVRVLRGAARGAVDVPADAGRGVDRPALQRRADGPVLPGGGVRRGLADHPRRRPDRRRPGGDARGPGAAGRGARGGADGHRDGDQPEPGPGAAHDGGAGRLRALARPAGRRARPDAGPAGRRRRDRRGGRALRPLQRGAARHHDRPPAHLGVHRRRAAQRRRTTCTTPTADRWATTSTPTSAPSRAPR